MGTLGGMPLSRIDNVATDAAAAWPSSPHAAAMQALVYRRRLREPPRDRALRIAALAGALLIHLVFVFGVILGPAYDLPESTGSEALMVRLIDKPEPPPPPPVRGRAPKRQAPVRTTAPLTAKADRSRRTTAALRAAPLAPPPTPTIQPPVIAMTPPRQTVEIRPVAAPVPPQSLPQSAPTPSLAPIPLPAAPPPTLAVQTPTTAIPVPPKFHPEPVRAARAEGTEAMPDPASLVIPAVPTAALPQAEAPPMIVPPTLAAAVAISAPVVTPAVAAAPPAPELQAIPLPVQPAPAVNLDSSAAITPLTPATQPQVQRDIAAVAEDSTPLAPVPLAEPASQPAILPPQAATPQLNPTRPALPALSLPATVAAMPDVSEQALTAQEQAPAEDSDTAPDAATDSAIANAGDSSEQTASASDVASSEGAAAPPGSAEQGSTSKAQGGSGEQVSSRSGRGSVPEAQGHGGAGAATEAGKAASGDYVQVLPHGDTRIMSHDLPPIGYTPTRFDKDWTPLHESSVDTAVRRVAEKITVKHTFNLPHGVRLNCMISPLGWMIALGCAPSPPQQTALAASVHARLNLAPAQPLVPPEPVASVAAPTTLVLDNSAACASARVARGPLPPGCQAASVPVAAPLNSSGSWVPASDQFH
jgi:hypothetical protein